MNIRSNILHFCDVSASARSTCFCAQEVFTGTLSGNISYKASMDWDDMVFSVTVSTDIRGEGSMPFARTGQKPE